MNMDVNKDAKRKYFEKNGYFIFKNILKKNELKRLNEFSDYVLSQKNKEHFKANLTTGSMVLINWDLVQKFKIIGELIANLRIKKEFSDMGFKCPKFGHGRIISKPANSPRLFWHEDGRFWNDPISYTTQPIQCFLMFYLTDTSRSNGCLRVIPESHRKRHILHDMAHEKHNKELKTFANPSDIQFQDVEGEIDVPLKAGDAIFGYANLFHSSHSNNSDKKRTLITLWYYPDYSNLPEKTRATIYSLEKQNYMPIFSKKENNMYSSYMIKYEGNAKIIKPEWKPGKKLI
tara:strand:- start:773 stop:1639 length:867 start_codon:yes stop_codon:yes gene_type:complete